MFPLITVLAPALIASGVLAQAHHSSPHVPPPAPVIAAIVRGDLVAIKRLVGRASLAGWDSVSQHRAIVAALYDAPGHFRPDIADYLLHHGVSIDSVGRIMGISMSSIMTAIFFDKPKMAAYCIMHGAHANTRISAGYNSVQFAARFGSVRLLQQLITGKSDMTTTDEVGETPFVSAAKWPNFDKSLMHANDGMKRLRIIWEATVKSRNVDRREYQRALTNAVSVGDPSSVGFLLSKDGFGPVDRSVVEIGVARGRADIVRTLLDAGAPFPGVASAGKSISDLVQDLDAPIAEQMTACLSRHLDRSQGAQASGRTAAAEGANPAPASPDKRPDSLTFNLVRSGAANRVGCFAPHWLKLTRNRPISVRKLPAGLSNPEYATITVGPPERRSSLQLTIDSSTIQRRIWVSVDGPDAAAALTPLALTQDSYLNREGRRCVTLTGRIEAPFWVGERRTTVSIGVIQFDPDDPDRSAFRGKLLYYGDYGFEGRAMLNGREYRSMVVDDSASCAYRSGADAPSGLRLLIDTNTDGAFEQEGESFEFGKPFNVGGITYDAVLPAGTTGGFRIRRAATEVLETPPLGYWARGDRAPALDLMTTARKRVSFPGDYAGKVVLLDFWATWCGPCRGEAPNLVSVYRDYHDKGLEILSVSLDEPGSAKQVSEMAARIEMTWPQIYDGAAWDSLPARAYLVKSIPRCFLIDGTTGKILAVGDALRGVDLRKTVDAALRR